MPRATVSGAAKAWAVFVSVQRPCVAEASHGPLQPLVRRLGKRRAKAPQG